MEVFFELLLNFLIEIGANLLFQLLVEVGLRSLVEPFRRSDRRNPLLAYLGCICLGAVAGFLSLLFLPRPLFHARHLQGYSLLFVPVVCGAAMAALRRLRERQGKTLVYMDSFTYGYTFAFCTNLVRYCRVW